MSMRSHGEACLLCACALVVCSAPAQALEVSGGVAVGGIQVGTEPRLALSPFVGWVWRKERDFRIEVHNMLSIVPGARVGIYDRTAVTLGYVTETGNVSLGPSMVIYAIPVCGVVFCDSVVGLAPGVRAQSDWFFAGRLGASVSANVDWAGGSSRFIPDSWVVMVAAWPVWRFGGEAK
ncbi:hypothetical protein [Sorangium sp. So ce1335]|uniref:hypothetical protein n=1 Tax=Sorangium sp. So ce1335 TaxID=3133335 RepID=UPI003F61156B